MPPGEMYGTIAAAELKEEDPCSSDIEQASENSKSQVGVCMFVDFFFIRLC